MEYEIIIASLLKKDEENNVTQFRNKEGKPKVMTEKEILTILRKRFKKHKFTETMFFKVD